jgi:formylglycine-generating enzyme required for sulfatase activity
MQGYTQRIFYLVILCLISTTLPAETFISPFGLNFVRLPAGEFIMGTEDFDQLAEEVDADKLDNLKKELPPHKVRISKDFYMATTEVTQSVWKQIMDSEPGSYKRWQREDWAQLPVAYVSWDSVQDFIRKVNEGDDRFVYRLPTEAEWEYAARAGTTGLRPFDYVEMDEYAWYRYSSDNKPMPVGQLKANAFGLYDMIGNVWEWVEDSYSENYYHISPNVDPPGPALASRKVMRGGSYHCTPERARVAIRGSNMRHNGLPVLGFRLAAELKQ